jgi:hypothetical protein
LTGFAPRRYRFNVPKPPGRTFKEAAMLRTTARKSTRQSGQGMTEYIVLVVTLFIGLIPVMAALQEAFNRYYNFVATWISLPIP